jgi:hypothetical protein
MRSKLKSCPFCGNDDIQILKQLPVTITTSKSKSPDKPPQKWLIRCPLCCAYKTAFGSKSQCYTEWNQRVP